MAEAPPVSPPVSKGLLENYLVKKWSSKIRWRTRLVIVILQFALVIASVLVPKSSGTTLLTMVILAFAFPPMLNALLQGLATRGIRVGAVLFILVLMLLVVVGMDATFLSAAHCYEWIIGVGSPIAAIALIVVPEPTADVDLFGLADRKGLKWSLLCVSLAILVAVIWFVVIEPLIPS